MKGAHHFLTGERKSAENLDTKERFDLEGKRIETSTALVRPRGKDKDPPLTDRDFTLPPNTSMALVQDIEAQELNALPLSDTETTTAR